jgi:hypothetical protein
MYAPPSACADDGIASSTVVISEATSARILPPSDRLD